MNGCDRQLIISSHVHLSFHEHQLLMPAQVKSAYSSSTQVQRSNYDYIRVFASRWQGFAPIPVAAILTHLDQSAPQEKDGKALRELFSRRALGMKLLCAGSRCIQQQSSVAHCKNLPALRQFDKAVQVSCTCRQADTRADAQYAYAVTMMCFGNPLRA